MKSSTYIFVLIFVIVSNLQRNGHTQVIDIYKEPFIIPEISINIPLFSDSVCPQSISDYTDLLYHSAFSKIAQNLNEYKNQYQLSDWMFYQIVRRTANHFFPKQLNYESYTVMKWYLLYNAGYDVRLTVTDGKLLFYAFTTEELEDIPFFVMDGKSYYCLNIHDFEKVDFNEHPLYNVPRIRSKKSLSNFSYTIYQLPDFVDDQFSHKVIDFRYDGRLFQFTIPVNNSLDTLFTNYPVVDYEMYVNIPLSHHTYNMLIPQLKDAVKELDTLQGVDYLTTFARDAFSYENDVVTYSGKERRFSPEQTLISDKSDCDDRVGLLYLLIKEIYNLPMIVVQFPNHVVLGVTLEKKDGDYFEYQGKQYLVCEPTPQMIDYPIGKLGNRFKNQAFEIAYAYHP